MNKKILFLAVVLLAGCSGGKTDDTGEPINPANPGPSGGSPLGAKAYIELEIKEDLLNVSDTTGYFVRLKDPQGRALKNQRIYCDSEEGVAVVEPRTTQTNDGSRNNEGSFLTDSQGQTSGVFGCEEIGSYRVMCRAKVGTDVTAYDTIRCRAPIPVGFAGFAGAKGGGLGGGSVLNPPPTDDNDGNTGTVRATSITFNEADVVSTTSIDLSRDSDCDNDATTVDPEPFSDTLVQFQIINNSTKKVQLKGYRFKILNSTAKTSGRVAFVGEQDVEANGGAGTYSALMLQSNGSAINPGRTVPLTDDADSGTDTLTPSTFNGIYNIQFEIFYANDDENEKSFTAVQSVGIGTYDRCGN